MPHDEDDDPQWNDLLHREKLGLEAQEKWSDAMCRVADAAEHGAMMQVAMMLTGMGLEPGAPPNAKHRVNCPCCIMIRDSKQGRVIQPGGDLGVVLTNGARKK